jgi:TolA-binding protein
MKPIVIIGIALVVVLIPVAVYGYMWLIPMTGNAIANMDPMNVKCNELMDKMELKTKEMNQLRKEVDNSEYRLPSDFDSDINRMNERLTEMNDILKEIWQNCMTEQEKQQMIRDNPDFDYSRFVED